MIIGDGIILGAGGETASIVVTAPTGSTVTCTTPAGIVLTAAEVDGTWTFAKLKVYGAYTITATDGTDTATLDVLVDSAVAYNVEISYRNIDENIVLLIDGNNIEDISTYQRAITNNGVTLSDAQTKFFDKSLYFNGSAILQFDAYTLGTSDFTIDFWMYNTATSNAYRRWITGNNGSFVDGTFCIRETSSGVIQTQNVTSSTSVPRNQWVHIAAVRSNGTLKIYLNGTEIASVSDSNNYSEALKYIGGYYNSIGNETFQGYMDEIRISNVARWTSNFTPPTRPY